MKEHTKNLLSIFCPLGLLLLAGLLFLGNNRPFPILSGMIEKARKEQISSERKIRQLEEGIAEKQEELNDCMKSVNGRFHRTIPMSLELSAAVSNRSSTHPVHR